ncbi:MAG TPA: hypothetical protein VIM25_00775 [Candidatus Limnocylindrales bacterium]
MNRGGVLTRALLFAASSPAIWPLALATFLLRGGIVILALPILVLPTPAGLANVFAPTLTALVFGSISMEVYVVGGLATAGLVVWLAVGGWVAAVLEAEAARIVALDEGVHASRPRPLARSHVAGRILAARLVALVPLAIALALGSVRIVLGHVSGTDEPARRLDATRHARPARVARGRRRGHRHLDPR